MILLVRTRDITRPRVREKDLLPERVQVEEGGDVVRWVENVGAQCLEFGSLQLCKNVSELAQERGGRQHTSNGADPGNASEQGLGRRPALHLYSQLRFRSTPKQPLPTS